MKRLAFIAIALLLAFSVYGVDFYSYRMNFPDGEARVHLQTLTYTGSSLTVAIPSGFTLNNNTAGGNVTGSNLTWGNGNNRNVNFTLTSPSSCTESSRHYSNIYVNNTFHDRFLFVCVPDNKVVDFKVEYGHGDANYLSDNQLYISNESVTLFNLLRVWNIGHFLDPDEDAMNATIVCEYENYPVRTYGRTEIDYGTTDINGTFFWNAVEGGYWFRIGVVGQDVSGKAVGQKYAVNCSDLTYTFNHARVIAPFQNYALEVRSIYPFNITFQNITGDATKSKVTIQNIEKYPAFDIYFDRSYNGFQSTARLLQLDPGESASYEIDRTSTHNFTLHFIPSWFRNSRNPLYYAQAFNHSEGGNPVIGDAAHIPDITFLEDTNYSLLDLDMYVDDPDHADSELNWTASGQVNITVVIDNSTHVVTFIPDPDFDGTEQITFTAIDPDGLNSSDVVNVTVIGSNDLPVILGTIPHQYRGLNYSSWTLNLTQYESDVDDENADLQWYATGVDEILFNVTIASNDIATFTVLRNISGRDVIALVLNDSNGATDSQDIELNINMSIDLTLGWNLMSVPPVKNHSIMNILAQLGNGNFGCGRTANASYCNASGGDFVGNWNSIQYFNVSDGTWLVFNPTDYYLTIPSGQEIQTIDVDKGYWIEMTANDTLVLDYEI